MLNVYDRSQFNYDSHFQRWVWLEKNGRSYLFASSSSKFDYLVHSLKILSSILYIYIHTVILANTFSQRKIMIRLTNNFPPRRLALNWCSVSLDQWGSYIKPELNTYYTNFIVLKIKKIFQFYVYSLYEIPKCELNTEKKYLLEKKIK